MGQGKTNKGGEKDKNIWAGSGGAVIALWRSIIFFVREKGYGAGAKGQNFERKEGEGKWGRKGGTGTGLKRVLITASGGPPTNKWDKRGTKPPGGKGRRRTLCNFSAAQGGSVGKLDTRG